MKQNQIQTAHKRLRITLLMCATGMLAACGSDMSDLQQWVADKKAERVIFKDDIPQVKPYEVFIYSAGNMRSPFQPAVEADAGSVKSNNNIQPVQNRNKEQLEQYSLDTLRMVGSLNRNNIVSALVQTGDGLIHQVVVGNYVGENDGRITAINDSQIELTEIIPDGLGGYMERPAAIGLSD
jgi:type IV pilus assembly protein PilP